MREGRLANVAGAVLCGPAAPPGAVRAAVDRLARICEDVIAVGGAEELSPARRVTAPEGALVSSLTRLVAALAATEAVRVLVVEASTQTPSAALLLALTAWPESDAVVPDRASLGRASMRCAIYRREPALAAARRRVAAGERDLAGLLGELAAVALEERDLAAILAD